MERIKLFYCNLIVCIIFILGICMNAVTVSAQEDDITWVTSKAEAVAQALSEGKYILLLAGASWCSHCTAMHYFICEEDDPAYPIKSVILENYVPWFADADLSSEWMDYAPGPDYYIPSTSRIDPRTPDNYIDQYYGDYGYYSNPSLAKETFYNRLLNGLGDIDDDGMPDHWERQYGLDALVNDTSGDVDEDGLTNINEYSAGTYPNDADSDNDGMPDGWEVQYGLNPLIKNDASGDIDGDGVTNIDEYSAGTYPNDTDSDDDIMPDGWEIQYGLNPIVDDADKDADGDNFSNLKEYLKETIPNDAGSHPPRSMPWLPLLLEGD